MVKWLKGLKDLGVSKFKGGLKRCQGLQHRGVVSIWLLLMLVIMVTGFAMLYQGLLGVYRANEALRSAHSASRLVLSYYDATLFKNYELLAYEYKESILEQARVLTEDASLAFKPLDPAVKLSNFQGQMIGLGKAEVVKALAEQLGAGGQAESQGDSQGDSHYNAIEAVPEEAVEGKKPTERQWSIWRGLKRFTSGGKTQNLSGLNEAIPQALMDAAYGFDGSTARSLSLTERYAVTSFIRDKFSSKFHPHTAEDKRPLKSSELEYILGGYRTELQNGLYLHMKMSASRLPMNVMSILGSQERRMAAEAMAATVIAVFPMSVLGAEAAVVGLWGTIETEVEMRRLYNGQLIPFVKTPNGTWYTDIESIASYSEHNDPLSLGGEIQASKPGWLNYDDQLSLFLGLQSDGLTAVRVLKLIDVNLRAEGHVLPWQNLFTGISVQSGEGKEVKKGYLHGD